MRGTPSRTSGSKWARLAGSLFLLALLAPMPAAAAKRVALLVGANEGWSEPALSFARKDARKLREVLVQRGRFATEDIVLLEDPTADAVRDQLSAMKRRFSGPGEEETLFVFYYSGHADSEYLHLRGEPELSFKELLRSMREVPASQKLGILDACQSGSILKGAVSAARGFDISQEELAVSGLALLVSSTANEPSQESQQLAGSFFTHYLVSGLFGQADVNGDHRISLGEVSLYARESTAAATTDTPAGAQHPGVKFEISGYEELYLSYLGGADALLTFPPSQHRCYLTDVFETRLLVEISPGDTGKSVRVPAGTYVLKCELSERQLRIARIELKAGESVDTTGVAFSERPRASSLVKGGSALQPRTLMTIGSGAVLASGGVLWAFAKHEQSKFRMGRSDASIARGNTYQRVSFGLVAAGTAGLGVAAALHLLRPPKVSGSLGAGSTGTSVFVHGAWP